MARRPTPRAILKVEGLEKREVLSSGGPSGEVQEMLELVNFARQHPSQAAEWAGSDLQTDNLGLTLKTFKVDLNRAKADIASKPAVQPLAWNGSLASAANTLNRFMEKTGQQTHTGGGTLDDGTVVGVTGDDRISNAGYTGRAVSGENAFAYATSVENSMKAFLIDWGNDPSVKPHLTNLFRPEYREVGIDVRVSSNKTLGPKIITQDFAARAGAQPMLLGVAYNDSVKADHMYQAGEGVGDVSVDVTGADGKTQTVNTWDSGGYQIALAPGTYTVKARVGNRVFRTQQVTIGDQNVKVDFDLADPWSGETLAPAPVTTPAPAPVVAPTPAPAPVQAEVIKPPVATPKPTVAVSSIPAVTPPVVAPVVTPVVASTPAATPVAPKGADVATLQALNPSNPLNSASDIQWQSW